ncbi:MAG: CPBP family intramembrane metalloprotease [Planctomycetes bacterium]|nr:CPBP family intramembrane metalloprotease [Planctomycetota bacterium]MCP4770598.1 CPBP family intramembrane metalloprotease [Planctomycetota bacterium]MCP4861075.1 CPBP family intramembrane metalloprotease [Planctomycetota bacterium]
MIELSLEFAWLLFSGGLLLLVTGIALSSLGQQGREVAAGCDLPIRHLLGALIAALLVSWAVNNRLPMALHLIAQALAAIGYLRVVGGRVGWFLPGVFLRRWSWAVKIWIASLPGLVGLIRINDFLFQHVFEGVSGNPVAIDFWQLPHAQMVWIAPVIVLIMPVLEEVLFRGYLFRMLIASKPQTDAKRRFSTLGALLASSLMFALAHNPGMWIIAFYLGVMLAWLDWRGGDLRLCMLVHGIHNAVFLAMA